MRHEEGKNTPRPQERRALSRILDVLDDIHPEHGLLSTDQARRVLRSALTFYDVPEVNAEHEWPNLEQLNKLKEQMLLEAETAAERRMTEIMERPPGWLIEGLQERIEKIERNTRKRTAAEGRQRQHCFAEVKVGDEVLAAATSGRGRSVAFTRGTVVVPIGSELIVNGKAVPADTVVSVGDVIGLRRLNEETKAEPVRLDGLDDVPDLTELERRAPTELMQRRPRPHEITVVDDQGPLNRPRDPRQGMTFADNNPELAHGDQSVMINPTEGELRIEAAAGEISNLLAAAKSKDPDAITFPPPEAMHGFADQFPGSDYQ